MRALRILEAGWLEAGVCACGVWGCCCGEEKPSGDRSETGFWLSTCCISLVMGVMGSWRGEGIAKGPASWCCCLAWPSAGSS